MTKNIAIPKARVANFCHRHHIRRLSLFGSVLREDFGPESDVDVLVEFEPDTTVGFFKLYDLEQELSQILDSRRVEINTPRSLSKYFRDTVVAEAKTLYVQA